MSKLELSDKCKEAWWFLRLYGTDDFNSSKASCINHLRKYAISHFNKRDLKGFGSLTIEELSEYHLDLRIALYLQLITHNLDIYTRQTCVIIAKEMNHGH